MKINISGSGNIQLLNMPEINLPSGFDKYDPKTSDQINRTGRVNGTKTFEYLIVPRDAGKKEIPPIQFSFYNPERNRTLHYTHPLILLMFNKVPIMETVMLRDIQKKRLSCLVRTLCT